MTNPTPSNTSSTEERECLVSAVKGALKHLFLNGKLEDPAVARAVVAALSQRKEERE